MNPWHPGGRFLSTPSARRAPRLAVLHPARSGISIHALREEGDGEFYTPQSVDLKFLSTPSTRRATALKNQRRATCAISIHALREEGDITIEGDEAAAE